MFDFEAEETNALSKLTRPKKAAAKKVAAATDEKAADTPEKS